MVDKADTKQKQSELIAVVRIRGKVGIRETIARTLKMLNLHKKNWCIVLANTPENMGMITKVKDYTTFGEIDNKTYSELLRQRGKVVGNKPLTEAHLKKAKISLADLASGKAKLKNIPGAKKYFKLKPPVGGFERGGIRTAYAAGGALGYRGKDISKLIGRML